MEEEAEALEVNGQEDDAVVWRENAARIIPGGGASPGSLQMEDGAMAIIVSLDESEPHYCWAQDDQPGIPVVYLYEVGT